MVGRIGLTGEVGYEIVVPTSQHRTLWTELAEAGPFYYAETYHQQYLARNPRGYCGIGGTGVACPIGTGVAAA